MFAVRGLITQRYDVVNASAHVIHPSCQELLGLLMLVDVEQTTLSDEDVLTVQTFVNNGCSPTKTGEILAMKPATLVSKLYASGGVLETLRNFVDKLTSTPQREFTTTTIQEMYNAETQPNPVEEKVSGRGRKAEGASELLAILERLQPYLSSLLSKKDRDLLGMYIANKCNGKKTAKELGVSTTLVYYRLYGGASYQGILPYLQEFERSEQGIVEEPQQPEQPTATRNAGLSGTMLQAPFKYNTSNSNRQRNKANYRALIDALNKVDIYELMYPSKGRGTIFSAKEMQILKVFLDKEQGNLNPSITGKLADCSSYIGIFLYGRDGYAGQGTMTNLGILGKLNQRIGRNNQQAI